MNINEQPRYDISVKPGADYDIDYIYTEEDETPVDLTGWSVEAQIREFHEARDYFDFEGTVDDSGIHLHMANSLTTKLPFTRGFYDVFLTSPNESVKFKLVSGRVFVEPRSTR